MSEKTYADYVKEVAEKYGNAEIGKDAPLRAAGRRKCWLERDNFEKCGNEYASSGSSKGIGAMLQHCDSEVENMYKVCPIAWVDHFVRGYISTKYGKASKSVDKQDMKKI